ncbi:MAG: ChbG/HpnK family deacetylase [Hyphomonadaceae bacterium]|nr:ChbG/HpnK family deacetylase [Hyphomonadaceae bacterium]
MLILCADDYALTEGVSRAIGELAAARRLSATSVMVTTPHWPATAARLNVHRGHLAIGLHLNLTLGRPLGAMPRLAPKAVFPGRDRLIALALLGIASSAEIAQEIERQLQAFEQGLGFPPDHIDGHEHVHVLSGIRQPLLDVVSRRYAPIRPLIRDPSDRWQAMAARRTGPRLKAVVVGALALRLAAAAERAGVPTNHGFSGFSRFDPAVPYAQELADAMLATGPRHIVMCHPGHPDAELAKLDPVVERRRMEYDALMREVTLPERIWRPARSADGPPVDWSRS